MWIHSNFSSSQRSFGVLKGTRRISGNCDTWRDPMRYKLSWDWCRTSCQQEAITPTGAVLLSAQHTTALTTGTSLDEMSRSPTHGVGAQKSAVFSAIFEEPISSPHGPEESVLPGAFPNHTSRPPEKGRKSLLNPDNRILNKTAHEQYKPQTRPTLYCTPAVPE